ncbi:hypothetical protein Afil01_05940 [Actinorhabdospora filicis]|uniref:Uncharacterized protein n=1 Tax=Actinorhabdospora filicis TaxID=1785913 RepID=A0A9W6W1D9_9ACTN|nr:hypothetical protein [Actinorhabdospora filicis]GLZ75787.1 hypothetical protein Afil01_05940 [Actinorhabdospora filicis]
MTDWEHLGSAEAVRREVQAALPMGSTAEEIVSFTTAARLRHTRTDGVIHAEAAGGWTIRFHVPRGALTRLDIDRAAT